MNENTGREKSVNRVINTKGVWLLIILAKNGTKENEQTVPHITPLETQDEQWDMLES